jgi:glycosyltransferase involved in cell wall biosynthesis
MSSSMAAQAPYLSLIFPAYNEAGRIARTLESAYAWLDRQAWDYEIVVSADGTDGTREAAAEIGKTRGRLTVVGGPERRGKGRGIREGVRVARGSIIGFSDADNKTPIDELTKVLPWFDRGYDVVIGSRATPDAIVARRQPLYRHLGSKAFSVAMHVATGLWAIRDTQCGFKFFRGPVARDLFARQTVDGYMYDVEILALATRSGYRIREVGVHWADDGDSRLDLVAGNWRNTIDLLTISWNNVTRRR